jgi:hypothetical protein
LFEVICTGRRIGASFRHYIYLSTFNFWPLLTETIYFYHAIGSNDAIIIKRAARLPRNGNASALQPVSNPGSGPDRQDLLATQAMSVGSK